MKKLKEFNEKFKYRFLKNNLFKKIVIAFSAISIALLGLFGVTKVSANGISGIYENTGVAIYNGSTQKAFSNNMSDTLIWDYASGDQILIWFEYDASTGYNNHTIFEVYGICTHSITSTTGNKPSSATTLTTKTWTTKNTFWNDGSAVGYYGSMPEQDATTGNPGQELQYCEFPQYVTDDGDEHGWTMNLSGTASRGVFTYSIGAVWNNDTLECKQQYLLNYTAIRQGLLNDYANAVLYGTTSNNAAQAYNDGYETGYSEGKIDGANIQYTQTGGELASLFNAVFSAPVNWFKTMFDVELFGINISEMVLGLVMALLVAWLIKRFI